MDRKPTGRVKEFVAPLFTPIGAILSIALVAIILLFVLDVQDTNRNSGKLGDGIIKVEQGEEVILVPDDY